MYSNVDYVTDFTTFSEYDDYMFSLGYEAALEDYNINFDETSWAFKQAKKEIERNPNSKTMSNYTKEIAINTRAQELLTKNKQDNRDITLAKELGALYKDEHQRAKDEALVDAARARGVKTFVDEDKEAKRANRRANKWMSKESNTRMNRKPGETQEQFEARMRTLKEMKALSGPTKTSLPTQISAQISRSLSKVTPKQAAIGGGAALVALGAEQAIQGAATGTGLFKGLAANDNAKIRYANTLAAKGKLDKANKVLGTVKDKTKIAAAGYMAAQ